MRLVFAAFLAAHGIAHLVGFAVNWKLLESPEVPYKTTIFALDVGVTGIRTIGLVWLLLAFMFVAASIGLLLSTAWWHRLAQLAIAASFLLCLTAWPATRFGVLANVVAAAVLAAGRLPVP